MSRRQDALAAALLVVLAILLFADVLFGSRALAFGDLATFHYPGKKVLREVVLGGEFPYWNRALSAGQPLAANPQHEVFYPPTWLILLPDFAFAFHLLVALHVGLALVAMYALLRAMQMSIPVAVFGAISFGLGGVILSTVGLLPFLFSLAWLPLTCMFAYRKNVTLTAACLAMQLLVGEPTVVLMTVMLIAAYFPSWKIALAPLLAPLLAAVQILPALDHFRDSVRARGFVFALVSHWSAPLSRLGELFAPQHLEGTWMPSIYCGLAIPALVLVGLVRRVRGWVAFAITFAVAVLIAVGSHTPLLRIAYDAGLVRWLRYPEKFLLLALVAAIVFAARTLQSLALRPVWLWIIAALVLVDVGVRIPALMPRVDRTYYTTEPAVAHTLPAPRNAYRILHEADWRGEIPRAPKQELPSVLRDGMFAMVPLTYGFQTAVDIDYDLTALKATDDFGRAAFAISRVRPDWADVVAPMANVGFRAIHREGITFAPTPFRPRYAFADTVVPIRSHADFVRQLVAGPARGTAFVAAADLPALPRNRGSRSTVRSARESANRAEIDVETTAAAFLVMSVTPHKYWSVAIDGAEAEAVVTNAGFQGVVVPAGRHRVTMRYANPLVIAGAAISLATLLAVAFVRMRGL